MKFTTGIDSKLGRQFLLLIISGLIVSTAFAQELESASIDVFRLLMGLFGGLALFLFGIDQMSHGLKAVAGDGMAKLLGSVTKNRFIGAITGAFVTAILNSSSVTTVLVVGFITAGIMTLTQSIGVIMGANIGSTMTAQIVAFNVTQYAMLPIAIGFGMIFFGKTESMKHGGAMLFGLGLLFGGMGVMSDAMYPLRSYPPFLELMGQLENPLLGILVGAVFTGLVQSSAATTGIAIVMASEGLMSLPAGIALALGANIGTCATAVLASIGKPVAAKQAAAAHIVFNILGVLIWLPFIDLLAQLSASISPTYTELDGAARMAREVPRSAAPDRQCPHDLQRGQYGAVHLVHRGAGPARAAPGAGPRRAVAGNHQTEVHQRGFAGDADTGIGGCSYGNPSPGRHRVQHG